MEVFEREKKKNRHNVVRKKKNPRTGSGLTPLYFHKRVFSRFRFVKTKSYVLYRNYLTSYIGIFIHELKNSGFPAKTFVSA